MAAFAATLALCIMAHETASAFAAAAGTTSASSVLPLPEKLKQLQQLLDDPAVKEWATRVQPSVPAKGSPPQSMSVISERVGAIRGHLRELIEAAGNLPQEIGQARSNLSLEATTFGAGRILLIVGLVLALAFGARWAVQSLDSRGLRTDGSNTSGRRDVGPQSVRAVWASLAFAVAGSIPLFLFDWPLILQKAIIVFLLALSGIWLTMAIARLMVASAYGKDQADASPLLNTPPPAKAFWIRQTVLFLTYFLIGWALVSVMPALGFSPGAHALVAYLLGLGLLAIAITAVWRRPVMQNPATRNVGQATLLTVLFMALWMLWVGGLDALLWLGIYAVILPSTVLIVGSAAKEIALSHPGSSNQSRLLPVFVERTARALVIMLAVVWLGAMFNLGTESLVGSETLLASIVRGVLSGIIILLVADLLWQIARTFIDFKLEEARADLPGSDEEMTNRAKLRTLLPIFRNILAVVLAIVAFLMVLASLGVQIAPLIAGAGVLGVAVGFGAQTLVKDIISGMFYLWDDAFRVGEYIQSGQYMGTVESFSLRSVRLRHHRGPVFTVPFGELGAVQNMSRDWAIEKMTLDVTRNTDIAKAKKVIKQIGQDLQENPEFGPFIIETLKMKGVEKFTDFSIQIRLGMKTKPGQQFVIRRRAYAMIQEAFKESGIELALPTVQVTGDDGSSPQAAAAARNLARRA